MMALIFASGMASYIHDITDNYCKCYNCIAEECKHRKSSGGIFGKKNKPKNNYPHMNLEFLYVTSVFIFGIFCAYVYGANNNCNCKLK